MKEDSIKHVELIQNVINRLNANSFRIKGWAITLVSAIFALTGTIRDPAISFIAIGPILMFWVLDSIFLANERCFVSLYNCVTNEGILPVDSEVLKKSAKAKLKGKTTRIFVANSFSMNFNQFKEMKRNNWWLVMISDTIYWFYFSLIFLTVFTFIGLNELIVKDVKNIFQVEATVRGMNPIQVDPTEVKSSVMSIDTLILKYIDEK